MARAIWSGTLSFGLLNIPVSLMSGERRTDISLRMLDARSNTPIRYERVNAETGAEVPWKDIVKAFEYSKGSYVVVDSDAIKSAAPQSHDAIEVEGFVGRDEIGPQYFEKPYVLVPAKKAEKGYVLLRQALQNTDRVGVARVVIRTREHLCAIIPQGSALLMLMMRYPQEIVDVDDYNIPDKDLESYRISKKELEFSEQLINAMSATWQPDDYVDEFRERLQEVIRKRIEEDGSTPEAVEVPDHAATNVVDFMELLRKSIASKDTKPAAKKAAVKKAPRKASAGKATKKTASKKTASKSAKSARKQRA